VPIAVDARVGAALDAALGRLGVGRFSALLEALAGAIHAATGQDDQLLFTYHANRFLPGFPRVVEVLGPLVDALPLRLHRVAGSRADRVRAAGRVVAGALANAIPPQFMIRGMGLPVPAVRASLTYQSFLPPSARAVGPLTVSVLEPVGFGEGQASFDLELVLWPSGEGLAGIAAYSTQVFREPTVRALVDRFLRGLEEIAFETA
jgi:hypothetical protein